MERLTDDKFEPNSASRMGSVTNWIDSLKAGDPTAASKLWHRYFQRLIALAQARLRKLNHHQAHDGEDVAQSAFISLCEGASHGRFNQLGDRDDLWRLLVVITSRKAADLRLHEQRLKRGGGRVYSESQLPRSQANSTSDALLHEIADDEPTPAFAAMLAEEYSKRLARLPKEELRRIAVLRMEGYTNEEIAEKLGCAIRTVARRLDWIRESFRDEEGTPKAVDSDTPP